MNYSVENIDIEDLDQFKIPSSDKPFILAILNKGVKFEFLIKNKQGAENILIMGSGSFDSSKMNLPIFHRHAWIKDFNETVVMFNDPTLYLGELTLGWGNGTADRYYLKEIYNILEILIKKLNFNFRNTFLYGSSAGGYMALLLAGYMKGATAIVNNPQIIVKNFWRKPVKKMIEVCYPGMSIEEVIKKYPERMNVIDFYEDINYIPRIKYLQNTAAEMDIQNHLIPFISGLNKLSKSDQPLNVDVELYSDSQKGHNPVSKDETISLINKVIGRK